MSYSLHSQGENCRKLQLFVRGLLFSFKLRDYKGITGVAAGREKGGRKPEVSFCELQAVYCSMQLFFLETLNWTVKLIEGSVKASLLNGRFTDWGKIIAYM